MGVIERVVIEILKVLILKRDAHYLRDIRANMQAFRNYYPINTPTFGWNLYMFRTLTTSRYPCTAVVLHIQVVCKRSVSPLTEKRKQWENGEKRNGA